MVEIVDKPSPGKRLVASLLLPMMVLAMITVGISTIPSMAEAGPPLFRADGGWALETVDSAGDVGYFTSIALDSDGKTHISYFDSTETALKYATNAGGSWSFETVDGAGDVGWFTSIAIDSSDKAHISYHDSSSADLKYATNAGGSWTTTTLASAGETGGYTSIAIDSSDKVHISYYDNTATALKYASNAGGSWATTTVDSTDDTGRHTSIAIDSNDRAHISYYDYTQSALRYANNTGGSWATTTLDSADDTGWYTSIALDSNDRVYISYMDYTNKRVRCATNSDGSWDTWNFDYDTGCGYYSSIAIDSDDRVHISYHWASGADHELRYFTNVGSFFEVETVDSRNAGGHTSIAVDSEGKAHISYLDVMAGDLRYATDAIWYMETIDNTGAVGTGASIDIDPSGNLHVSYQDSTNGYLKYATNAMGYWTTTTVDASGDVGDYTSIAVGSDGKAHISYHDATAGDLRYATNAAGSWATYLVDSSDHVGQHSSIAVASDGDLFISYYDETNDDLKCAYRSGTLWKHGAVDSYGNVGLYTSIALDSDDKAHISYYNSSGQMLKYATNAGGSWEAITVDDHANVGWDTSIAIDSNDKVHISYYDVTASRLRYAYNTFGGWGSMSPEYGSNGYYSSIAIDSEDNPHISYRDIANHCLKYTTRSGVDWDRTYVDRAGSTGGFTSLALDSNDKAHIVYYDYTNTALKYATNAPWRLQSIDTSGFVGRYSSIAFDSNDKIHISYFDDANNLRYIDNVGGTWAMTVVDSGVNDVGKFTSLALDSNDKVYISYTDETAGRLRYATNAGGSWAVFSFLSDGVAGLYTSIAIDSNDKVHISHYDVTHGDLKYTTNAGGTWSTVTVDDGGTDEVGQWTSLALDSNDKVHISYVDYTHNRLKYATNAGGTWSAVVVDGSVCGMYSSIAIDSDDKAHISYWGYTGRDLKYATNTGGTWTSEVADAEGETGLMTSIALDSHDNAHVSYYDSMNTRLRYASNAGGAWHNATVDINAAGGFPSIALDSSDRACISYLDFSKGDLKLAFELSEPSAPRDLHAECSPGSVSLQWSSPLSDHGFEKSAYRIYRGSTPSTLRPLDTASGDLLIYTDGSLPAGTYCYAMAAVNAVGRGLLSNLVSVTMMPPGAPTGLAAVPGDSQVVLNWTAPADDGGFPITNYVVYRGTTPGGEGSLANAGAVLTYTDTDVTNGQTYYYVVKASNAMGKGEISNEVSATPMTLPSAPLGLTAAAGDAQVFLNWTAPSSDGGSPIAGYKVYRGLASGSETWLYNLSNVLNHTDTGLTNGQTYHYKLSAINDAGEGPQSDEASATPVAVPSAPIGLTASAGDSCVVLNWTAPAYLGPGAITYHLFRNGTLVWSGEELEHNDSGLVNGVTYSYTVSASNDVGWGPNSTEVQATPLATDTVPSAPVGLAAIPGDGSIDLNWTAPSYLGPGTITFHLFRDGELVWSGAGLSYHDAPLAKGAQHSYSVAAQNDLGWGPNCSAVLASAFGVPDEPWGLSAIAGDAHATLSWNAVNYSGPGDLSYHLFRDGDLVWSGNATSHDDVGLSNGQIYEYQVACSNSIGWSANSSIASVVPQGPPTAPRGLRAVTGDGLIKLNWTSPSYPGPGPLAYHLFRDGTLVWSGASLAYDDTNVTNLIEYSYEVAAENAIGYGPNSTAVLAVPGEMTPSAPRGLAAVAGKGNATLTWEPPVYSNASAVVGYMISYGTSPDSLTGHITWNGLTYALQGLTKGQVYYFKVAAQNSAGWGPNSTAASATPFGVPDAPSGLAADAGDSYVQLSWGAPSYIGPGTITYHLFRSGGLYWSGSATSFNDTVVANGVPYSYTVAAQNGVGWGQNSTSVSATPSAAPVPPGAPMGLQAGPGDGVVTLTWSAPSQPGSSAITGYKIYRGTTSGGEALLATLGNVLTYSDDNVSNGQTYYYRVSALSPAGEGALAPEASATPSAPGGDDGGMALLVIAVAVVALAGGAAVWLYVRRRR